LAAAGPLPLGAVGAIYAEPDELASHVRELLVHQAHYHTSANKFSRAWADYHSPERLASRLTEADACNEPAPAAEAARRAA
jgi:hypothetical protein